MTIFKPVRSSADLARCLRMVNASKSAWLGCSCVPSPALITAPDIHFESAKRCAAPDAPWRMITASAPMACKVCAVSFRDSPLLILDPLAEKLITSADKRFAAASKEMRVLVESSAKRLTIVRPRSVGSFFIGPSLTRASSCAVSRMAIASALERLFIDKRCFTSRHLQSRLHRYRRVRSDERQRFDRSMSADSFLQNQRESEVPDARDLPRPPTEHS